MENFSPVPQFVLKIQQVEFYSILAHFSKSANSNLLTSLTSQIFGRSRTKALCKGSLIVYTLHQIHINKVDRLCYVGSGDF